jgi:hypothetical protein
MRIDPKKNASKCRLASANDFSLPLRLLINPRNLGSENIGFDPVKATSHLP